MKEQNLLQPAQQTADTPRKMNGEKFCFVMPFHIMEGRGGGAEVQSLLLAKELVRRGFKVSYIAQSTRGQQGRQEIIDGVSVIWVKYAHHFRWTNGVQYYRALKGENPDFVVQRMSSPTTGVAGLYCKIHKKKFVWICTDNTSPFQWMSLKKQIGLNRQEKVHRVKGAIFFLNALVCDLSRHFGMKYITYPFTQNEFQNQSMKDSFGLDSFRMISGHEKPKKIIPAEHRLRDCIVLWVANLGSNKRPEKFIELARLNRDKDIRFVMIGGRMNSKYIESLFQRKPDNLEWLGRRPFDETLEWFDRAAFFVNTSVSEGFPNTFIQAWLREVPVFSLGVDPDGIILKHELGYVSKDIDEISQRMLWLRKDVNEYSRLASRVGKYAREHYTVARMTNNFLNIVLGTGSV